MTNTGHGGSRKRLWESHQLAPRPFDEIRDDLRRRLLRDLHNLSGFTKEDKEDINRQFGHKFAETTWAVGVIKRVLGGITANSEPLEAKVAEQFDRVIYAMSGDEEAIEAAQFDVALQHLRQSLGVPLLFLRLWYLAIQGSNGTPFSTVLSAEQRALVMTRTGVQPMLMLMLMPPAEPAGADLLGRLFESMRRACKNIPGLLILPANKRI